MVNSYPDCLDLRLDIVKIAFGFSKGSPSAHHRLTYILLKHFLDQKLPFQRVDFLVQNPECKITV